MTLSDELSWRGFVNQTTYKDITVLNSQSITFYLGVDPSSDSMTVGNLAVMMMVRHFIEHGHKAILLVGGATGLIGDPDGKSEERDLKTLDEVATNKAKIAAQYQTVLSGQPFQLVDNYDWFKDMGYLRFLRDVGKHVPMRQMLGREFVQSRLGENGAGISYAEFSYSLMQGYDFLHLHREKQASLQLCGADQWGNSIAGVELIRRITGDEVHVWSAPLVVNKATGTKFGKSEGGAVWLDASKTSPYQFYQFWLNVDDDSVLDYIKIYTLLNKEAVDRLSDEFNQNRQARAAQKRLAYEVTMLIHGREQADRQVRVAEAIASQLLNDLTDNELTVLRAEIPSLRVAPEDSLVDALVASGLATSNTEARRLLSNNAIAVNGQKLQREQFQPSDFIDGRLLLKRGKAYKDTALVELR